MSRVDQLEGAIQELIKGSDPIVPGENAPLDPPPKYLVYTEGHGDLVGVDDEKELQAHLDEMPARRARALAELEIKEGDFVNLSKVNSLLSTLAAEAPFVGEHQIFDKLLGLFTIFVDASKEEVSGGLAHDALRMKVLNEISEIKNINPYSMKDQ